MGEYMASLGLIPDLIASSPAVRARQTAELFAEAVEYEGEITWDEGIYAASAGELLRVMRDLPEDSEHVVLVGHNPGFEDLADFLIEQEPGVPLPWDGVRLPTAATAHLLLNVSDWSDVRAGCGKLLWLMTPKALGQSEEWASNQ